ncbi:MAG: ankyrin repeat domain-containing protein [Pseudomonadota bacterium]
MQYKKFLLLLTGNLAGIFSFFICCQSIFADIGVSGAKYSCSTLPGIFEILPHDKTGVTSSPDPGRGYTALPDGISNLQCRLENRLLEGKINVIPPQDHGMCMAAGAVMIDSLVVDGVELLEQGIQFDWACSSEDRPVVKVIVRTNGLLVETEKCSTQSTPAEEVEEELKCSIQSFDVNAIAKTNAKIDNDLADPEIQARELATLLPPEKDLTHVFPTKVPTGTDIPLCAHSKPTFLAVYPAGQLEHVRIAGTVGERVAVYEKNPQLCQNAKDDGCSLKSYLLPGDLIDVGCVCGAWTYIAAWSRTHAKPGVIGWVETARVYGLSQLFKEKTTQIPAQLSFPAIKHNDDSLMNAVASRNPTLVESIIANGANPNGVDENGDPLAAAIQNGDLIMVNTLLSLGAEANAHPSDKALRCRNLTLGLEHAQIFDALVNAGIDLNCHDERNGETQLMKIAFYDRFWAWQRINHKEGNTPERLKDPSVLTERLLKAGADPNARDNDGSTAIFYTVKPNNIDIAELLLRYGANLNVSIDIKGFSVNSGGNSPLLEALSSYSYNPTLFQLFLSYGADPNYRNPKPYDQQLEDRFGINVFNGQTALTMASANGYYTIVRLLLENGADPTIPREDGIFSEIIARENNHYEIAELLSNFTNQQNTKTLIESPAN